MNGFWVTLFIHFGNRAMDWDFYKTEEEAVAEGKKHIENGGKKATVMYDRKTVHQFFNETTAEVTT